jgi:hypothetical protein
MKPIRIPVVVFSLVLSSACASSYAEPNRPSYGESSGRARSWTDATPVPYSPYGIELLTGDFRALPTFHRGAKTYVMGFIGDRYRIRITNPTPRRVEAVVSVDGLDAIDGKTASLQDKRGYVIGAYGEITIEGFRTSLDQVATFRFSSVRDSYAGRKGQDRNVGVIGVAFFPEREPAVRYLPPPLARDDQSRGPSPLPPSKAPANPYGGDSARGRGSAAAPSAEARSESAGGYGQPPAAPEVDRPGLGTEFGERRYSSVRYTSLLREHPTRPSHVVEIRYDDHEGLMALGIPVDDARPVVDDLWLRESADPFPQNRFASPPPAR